MSTLFPAHTESVQDSTSLLLAETGQSVLTHLSESQQLQLNFFNSPYQTVENSIEYMNTLYLKVQQKRKIESA